MAGQSCLAQRLTTGYQAQSVAGRRRFSCCIRSSPQRRPLVAAAALKGVLCDLDGVVYESGSAALIAGAAEAVAYFREQQVPWLFVTNTNTKTRAGLAARLRDLGIPASAEDIVTPAKLAADWLRQHDVGPTALFVAPELVPEFGGLSLLPPDAESGAAAVIIGDMGLDWNYATLNRAFRLVMEGTLRTEASGQAPPRPQCGGRVTASSTASTASSSTASSSSISSLASSNMSDDDDTPCAIPNGTANGTGTGSDGNHNNRRRRRNGLRPATGPLTVLSLGKGRYYKDTDGYSIDVGPFTSAIEYATDQEAVVLGKPDPLIFCLAAQSLGLQPDEVVMIGDDIRGDVGGAQAGGLVGVLVRTGKFREHDLQVGITPDAVLPSIAEFPAWWQQQQLQQQQQQQQAATMPELVGAGVGSQGREQRRGNMNGNGKTARAALAA